MKVSGSKKGNQIDLQLYWKKEDGIEQRVEGKAITERVAGIGMHGAYMLYSCCCLANLLVSFFVMPETKGLSLEDIEDLYRDKGKPIVQHKRKFSGTYL